MNWQDKIELPKDEEYNKFLNNISKTRKGLFRVPNLAVKDKVKDTDKVKDKVIININLNRN